MEIAARPTLGVPTGDPRPDTSASRPLDAGSVIERWGERLAIGALGALTRIESAPASSPSPTPAPGPRSSAAVVVLVGTLAAAVIVLAAIVVHSATSNASWRETQLQVDSIKAQVGSIDTRLASVEAAQQRQVECNAWTVEAFYAVVESRPLPPRPHCAVVAPMHR